MEKHRSRQDPVLQKKLLTVSREFRACPTPAEDFLWQKLRDRRLDGYKFRRQHPIDRFVVDFCCCSASLIIELDGPVHSQQMEADQERDAILTAMGYRVLRFTNNQVFHQIEAVLKKITETAYCR